MSTRLCSRNSCREPAVATLTYVYATSTAVVGPLAISAEPHAYDLCQLHAHGLTIPRGWELVRHDGDLRPSAPFPDDLVALAEAVREPSVREVSGREVPAREPGLREPAAGADPPGGPPRFGPRPGGRPSPRPRPAPDGRRGHLRIVQPPA